MESPAKRFNHGLPVPASDERNPEVSSTSAIAPRLIAAFATDVDPHLGLYGAFGYDLAFQFEPIRLRDSVRLPKDLDELGPGALERGVRRVEREQRLPLDACRYLDPTLKSYVRQESWKNAEEQGRLAACNILGAKEVYTATPWFWSHQYELTLQVAGAPSLGTWSVERQPDSSSLMLFHMFEDGRVAGVSSVAVGTAAARDIRIGQMFIEQQIKPDPVSLNQSRNLKSLLQVAAH